MVNSEANFLGLSYKFKKNDLWPGSAVHFPQNQK